MISPEILSPAGNTEMLTAAVRSGADAVYLGAKEFSARRNAANFDDDELKAAVEYCHIRGVKVYLTLNILIKDAELESAFRLAQRAYNYGIDGIIIADMGLAAVLHRLLPELPLHASTQMTVHTPSALPLLKKAGFCRVVAGREMSRAELKEFCAEAKRLGLETEVFVHGALCMSVSGQCLLSAFLGSRSGNRGLCAGPCRLPFSAPGGTGYDLSLKDLSLINHLNDLREMGVSSFKIEGRMKRPEYVAAATAACRSALDNGYVAEELDTALKNVFCRSGFTDGYFTGKTGREMFGTRTKEDVAAATGAMSFVHGIYRFERGNVKIDASLSARREEPLTLTLDDGENRVTVTGDIPQNAVNKAADEKSLIAGLEKFGSTPYTLKGISAVCDGGLFVSAAALNDLRRRACAELDSRRAEVNHPQNSAVYKPERTGGTRRKEPRLYARFESAGQIPDDLEGISALIFPLENEPEGLHSGIELIADIPRGIISDKTTAERLRLFKSAGFKTALCGNLSAVKTALDEGFSVIADTGMNVYNSESAAAVSGMGAERIVLSSEVTLADAESLCSPVPKGAVIYGNIPLMLFRNCPLKNGRDCKQCDRNGFLTDRKNTRFPVRCRMGYSELLNSVPVWLADKKDDIRGLDFAVLYFTRETKERVSEVIKAYKNGYACDTEYTRGLFYRGSL